MFRIIKLKKFNFQIIKVLYCSVPVDYKTPNHEIKKSQYKFDREFAKDMLLNRFNLDLFEYPEIDNNHDCDRVQQLAEKLERLFQRFDSSDAASVIGNGRAGPSDSTIIDQLSQSGLLGLCVPERHHGSGYNCMMLARIIEALSSRITGDSFTMGVLVPHVLATQAVLLGGDESHHRRYLQALSAGAMTGTVAMPTSAMSGRHEDGTSPTARLDSRDNSYWISGCCLETVAGLSSRADVLVAFAKTGEDKNVGAFIIDPHGQFSGCSASPDEVRVPAQNVLGNMSGLQLARKLSALQSVAVASSCSGLIRGLLGHANEFVSSRLVFGRPLSRFQVIHYEISRFTGDAYAAESVAFFAAGLYDHYHDNDLHIEASLAKIGALAALTRSVDRCHRLLGTVAVEGASANPILTGLLENARLLITNETPILSSKISVLHEAIDHVLSELTRPKSLSDRIFSFLIGSNPKALVKSRVYVDSFRYNLHQRVGALADRLYSELHSCERLLEGLALPSRGALLQQELVLETLASVLSDVFCIVAMLSRSSRSISIGLRNQDTEVLVTELQVKWRVQEISRQLHQLQRYNQQQQQPIGERFESLRVTAAHLKMLGGALQLHQSIGRADAAAAI